MKSDFKQTRKRTEGMTQNSLLFPTRDIFKVVCTCSNSLLLKLTTLLKLLSLMTFEYLFVFSSYQHSWPELLKTFSSLGFSYTILSVRPPSLLLTFSNIHCRVPFLELFWSHNTQNPECKCYRSQVDNIMLIHKKRWWGVRQTRRCMHLKKKGTVQCQLFCQAFWFSFFKKSLESRFLWRIFISVNINRLQIIQNFKK